MAKTKRIPLKKQFAGHWAGRISLWTPEGDRIDFTGPLHRHLAVFLVHALMARHDATVIRMVKKVTDYFDKQSGLSRTEYDRQFPFKAIRERNRTLVCFSEHLVQNDAHYVEELDRILLANEKVTFDYQNLKVVSPFWKKALDQLAPRITDHLGPDTWEVLV